MCPKVFKSVRCTILELFAIKIRNSSIQGIKISSDADVRIEIKQLAEDTTLFLKDRDDIILASVVLKRFQTFSGLEFNILKTKALQIGKNTDAHNVPIH